MRCLPGKLPHEAQSGLQSDTGKGGKLVQAELVGGFLLWAMGIQLHWNPLSDCTLRSVPPRGKEAWLSNDQVLSLLGFNCLAL